MFVSGRFFFVSVKCPRFRKYSGLNRSHAVGRHGATLLDGQQYQWVRAREPAILTTGSHDST